MPGKVDVIELMTDEKLQEYKNIREHCDTPSIPYFTPQPDKVGKLLWFSGPPGAGKSTTAQLMGRYHKYVYYEADCFGSFMNPFVDLHADDPTMMQMAQAPLYVSYKL